MQNTLSGISHKWIQPADSGDSAPRIYFWGLRGAAWPAWERVFSTELCSSQPPGAPLGRAGWWHTGHRDRLLWRRLEHGAEQLWRLSTSASPAVPCFYPHVGFQSTSAAAGSAAALMHHAGIRAPGWIFPHCVSKQLQGCSTCPQPLPAWDLAGQAELPTFWATNDGQGGSSAADRPWPQQGSQDGAHSSGLPLGCPRGGDCRQATCWVRNKIHLEPTLGASMLKRKK